MRKYKKHKKIQNMTQWFEEDLTFDCLDSPEFSTVSIMRKKIPKQDKIRKFPKQEKKEK